MDGQRRVFSWLLSADLINEEEERERGVQGRQRLALEEERGSVSGREQLGSPQWTRREKESWMEMQGG